MVLRIPNDRLPFMNKQKLFFILGLGVLLLGALTLYFRPELLTPLTPTTLVKKEKLSLPVPVVVATVEARNVPIYLDGIGTVQPSSSVLIRPRINGTLEKVVFQEGQNIKQGDLLAVIDDRPYRAALDQAIAKKNEDQAALNNATLALNRSTDLLQKNVLSQQDFDKARFLVDQLTAQLAWDQAAIGNAQTELSYTQITSPINGRAGVLLVDQGNLVHATDTNGIVLINQMQPITVLFTLPEKDLLSIQQQQTKSPLTVIALDRNNTKQLASGKVTVIDNQIDQTTGTVKLKATFANEDLSLWPGQFINCRLLLKTLSNALVVPSAALQRGPQGAFVYIITDQNKAEMRKVTVGDTDAGTTIIEDGLQLNERVVIDGQYKLKQGASVIVEAKS